MDKVYNNNYWGDDPKVRSWWFIGAKTLISPADVLKKDSYDTPLLLRLSFFFALRANWFTAVLAFALLVFLCVNLANSFLYGLGFEGKVPLTCLFYLLAIVALFAAMLIPWVYVDNKPGSLAKNSQRTHAAYVSLIGAALGLSVDGGKSRICSVNYWERLYKDTVSALSYGNVTDWENFTEDDYKAIIRIWQHCRKNGLVLPKHTTLKKAIAIGREHGAEDMTKAYFSGVPLEDILI